MVYVASLNDQVVPIYSGIFTAASHPLILRALYIDGDAYQCVSSSILSLPPFLSPSLLPPSLLPSVISLVGRY